MRAQLLTIAWQWRCAFKAAPQWQPSQTLASCIGVHKHSRGACSSTPASTSCPKTTLSSTISTPCSGACVADGCEAPTGSASCHWQARRCFATAILPGAVVAFVTDLVALRRRWVACECADESRVSSSPLGVQTGCAHPRRAQRMHPSDEQTQPDTNAQSSISRGLQCGEQVGSGC